MQITTRALYGYYKRVSDFGRSKVIRMGRWYTYTYDIPNSRRVRASGNEDECSVRGVQVYNSMREGGGGGG